jgi:hypothetical protein
MTIRYRVDKKGCEHIEIKAGRPAREGKDLKTALLAALKEGGLNPSAVIGELGKLGYKPKEPKA